LDNQVTFAIVGAGWRSEFYLRIAAALPERFRVSGVLVRSAEKAEAVAAKWGVNAIAGTIGDLLKTSPEFIVTSLPWKANPALVLELAAHKATILSETPPAPDLDEMRRLWAEVGGDARIQVAEQYPFQPLHAARIALAGSGKLGRIWHANVSAAHGYHGVALIRRLLGLGIEPCVIRAIKVSSDIVEGPGRGGAPAAERIKRSDQVIATLSFESGKTAVFDFTGEQYFAWIRSERVLVRGDRGEIANAEVSYLKDFKTPINYTLERQDTGHGGNLEGYSHTGYIGGDEWVYRNPLAPGRLADDEIAIGDCLLRMSEYAAGGAGFYGLAEGLHDHYLGMTIDRACALSEGVRTETQPWDS
jgi:predicted dehydrogenase